MEKEKRIKEMAKEIATVLFCDCLLNNGGRCCDCECNKKETKEYDCQSYLVAKKQFEQGYRKQEDILHEWVERETAYLNEIAELKKELKKELDEHEEFTKKANDENERLTEEANQDTITHIDICTENLSLRKQNAELQKQVNELKEKIMNLKSAMSDRVARKGYDSLLTMPEDVEEIFGDAYESEFNKFLEQAVKDTAKEIYELIDAVKEVFPNDHRGYDMAHGWSMCVNKLKEIIKRKGVEVE